MLYMLSSAQHQHQYQHQHHKIVHQKECIKECTKKYNKNSGAFKSAQKGQKTFFSKKVPKNHLLELGTYMVAFTHFWSECDDFLYWCKTVNIFLPKHDKHIAYFDKERNLKGWIVQTDIFHEDKNISTLEKLKFTNIFRYFFHCQKYLMCYF